MDIASLFLPSRPAKAQTGVGAVMMQNNPPLSLFARSPQAMAKDAQTIALADITIRSAERVISNRLASTDWDLEDTQGRTVGEENLEPGALAVLELLNVPYKPQPGDPRTATPRTWAQLIAVTSRHMGLCGAAYWYLDQADGLAGTPLQILYINPARMTPAIDDNGNLTGWVLDRDGYGNGTPLEADRVVQFQLEPPDSGFLPSGLVETALAKVELSKLSDRHVTMMLAAGGRLSGIMSPKEGFLEDAVYSQLVRDIRTISEAPDAAKRMLILRGPVEYKEAAATPSDIDLVALQTLSRDDKLSLWGVPHSILGIPTPGGLGGGTSKDSDEAIFWQNALGPRAAQIEEVIQTQLIDRYLALGIELEFEFEEPEFDDDMPKYDMAVKAAGQPLTNRERRDLLGLDPFGDARDDEVWLPSGLVPSYSVLGPGPNGDTYAAEEPHSEVQPENFRRLGTLSEMPYDDAIGKALDAPAYIAANARRGLRLYEEGRGGDGLVARTIREAREMAAGTISEDKAVRMAAWIARHLVDFDAPQNSDPQDPGYPGPGLVAHLLWGSGPNRAGAERAMRWAEAQRPAEKARVPGLIRMRAEDIRGMTDALAKVIAGLSAETARKVERNWAHIQQRPDDTSAYWSDEKAERLLLAAMEPYVKTVATQTVGAIEQRFAAKAGMLDIIIPRLLRSVGIQIKTVPRTLLKTVRSTIDEGLRDGLSARDLGKLIEERVGNNEYFAERIARTEAMRLQNAAAIEGYREAGITEVILRDGDEDEVCRARDGRRVPITEAQAEMLAEHPNGTLYFEPVTEFTAAFASPEQVEQPMTQKAATVAMPAITLSPTFQFTMPENPAPVVNVEAPVVNLPAPIVNIAAPEAPTVNVTTPEVVVNVPEAKAGLVQDIRIVEMPARSLSQVVVRDPSGKIIGVESASE